MAPQQIDMFGDDAASNKQAATPTVHRGRVDIVPTGKRRAMRRDRWTNTRNQFGGSSDPMTRTRFIRRRRLSRAEIDALFRQDWISRKAVEAPARDGTRKWIEFTPSTEPEPAEFIQSEFKRLRIRQVVRAGHIEARLYGGALIVLGAFDGGDVAEPLDVERVRFTRFVHVVDRFFGFPLKFVRDPDDPDFGRPESYLVTRAEIQGSTTKEVHASRVIILDGEFLPRLQRIANFGWGDSVMEKMHEALRQYGVATQSGAATLQDFVTKTLKIGNLRELLSNENFDAVETRLAEAAGQMSVHNIAAIGDDEALEKMGTPVRGLEQLIDLYISIVAAASGIPRSRLFHAQGGKLAGDGGASADLLTYYDDVHAMQEDLYAPAIDRLIDVLGAPRGYTAADVPYEFAPLMEMTEKQKAEVRRMNAESDTLYIQNGVVDPDDVARARFGGPGIATGDIIVNVEEREQGELT